MVAISIPLIGKFKVELGIVLSACLLLTLIQTITIKCVQYFIEICVGIYINVY